jgi:hypothetical protein
MESNRPPLDGLDHNKVAEVEAAAFGVRNSAAVLDGIGSNHIGVVLAGNNLGLANLCIVLADFHLDIVVG